MKWGACSQFIVALTVCGLMACGQPTDQKQEVGDSYNKGGVINPLTGGFSKELVDVPTKFQSTVESSLNLAGGLLLSSATSYTITLSGCSSGYTSTATNASTSLKVYKYDRGCLAKLTTFALNGKTYTVKTAFTTWQANDTATFEVAGASPADELTLKVVTTVNNTQITAIEAVEYSYYTILLGSTSTILAATVGLDDTLAVNGQGYPSFTINSISYVGMTAGGAGQFIFKMECSSNITGAGVEATTACLDGLWTDMRYKLIEDTYGSVLTLAQASALFPAGESSITWATDTIAVGAGGTTRGGFNTSTLDGPAAMHTKPNMILVLQVRDLSYKYFNVDVTVLTQN